MSNNIIPVDSVSSDDAQLKKITKVTLNTNGRLDLYLGSDMVFVDRLGSSTYSKIINIKFSSEHSDLVVETESGKIKNYNFRNVVSWDVE